MRAIPGESPSFFLEGGMSREQGPREAGMRPPAIAAARRQGDANFLILVKEA
jgi:hypothetical protein